MSTKLNLIAIEKEGCVRVAATGDLTAADFHPLGKNPLEAVLGDRWAEGRVLLDLRLTRFIDSAAIGWLISAQRDFRRKGGVLVVHSIEPRVRRMLEMLKVEKVVTLLGDEDAARKYVLKTAA